MNSIIGGFLDKRGVPDGLGSRENQAFRNARAKREAEEAGKQLSYFFWPCLNEDLYR